MSSEMAHVYEQPTAPEWGRGVLVATRDGKAYLQFEHGGRKAFKVDALPRLRVVDLPADEAAALAAALRGRKPAAAKKTSTARARAKEQAAAARITFHDFSLQLAAFEALFPGGFAGERFVAEERGAPGQRDRKKALKQAAVELARASLAPERFAGDPEELYSAVAALVTASRMVHPLEGGVALASLPPERRPAFLEALRELVHGAGEFGPRLERFATAAPLRDKEGKARALTWPAATLFCAAYHPDEHVAVRPTAFKLQAGLVGVDLHYHSAVSGHVYGQFLEIARATRERLVQAGHAPRDLLDVHSFIVRTHGDSVPVPARG